MTKPRYKVSYINARTGKQDYIRDHKRNIRYYSKEKAAAMAKIVKHRKGRIVKV